jgi:hypothetical protein
VEEIDRPLLLQPLDGSLALGLELREVVACGGTRGLCRRRLLRPPLGALLQHPPLEGEFGCQELIGRWRASVRDTALQHLLLLLLLLLAGECGKEAGVALECARLLRLQLAQPPFRHRLAQESLGLRDAANRLVAAQQRLERVALRAQLRRLGGDGAEGE